MIKTKSNGSGNTRATSWEPIFTDLQCACLFIIFTIFEQCSSVFVVRKHVGFPRSPYHNTIQNWEISLSKKPKPVRVYEDFSDDDETATLAVAVSLATREGLCSPRRAPSYSQQHTSYKTQPQ